jgi:2-polyprenyl-6-methoxyphenol hydroxylase-like FAD-dependent oxidoreductase
MIGSALVVGGGIGGLAVARALLANGWSVTVRERSDALPTTGTMLGMWPEAMRALDALRVGDRVRDLAAHVGRDAPAAGLRTADGRTLVTMEAAADIYLVSRPDLLASLAESVPVGFGQPVDGEDVVDWIGNEPQDVLVGADGTFSRTRAVLFGDRYAARSMGAVAWRGTVPGTVDRYGETWAPGAMFGISPTGRDATNYYGCVRATGPLPPPHRPRLEGLFASWPDEVGEVIARTDDSSILHHELFETPRLPSLVRGRVALVGDAAHAMGPFLGRGAGEALVDGMTLGRCLAQATSVADGLRAYDRARRRRTQALVRASSLMGRLAMLETGAGARDLLLRGVGTVVSRLRAGPATASEPRPADEAR